MAVDVIARAKAKVRALAASGDAIDDEPEPVEAGPTHELEIDEPDDDGGDDIDEPRPSRRERRRERGELHSALEASRAEAAALRAEKAALEARMAQQPKPADKPEVDPIDADLAKVYEEQDSLLTAWNAGVDKFTDAQKADYKKRAVDLETRKGILFAKKAGAGRQQQVDPLQMHRSGLDIQTRAAYPDVYGNEQALRYADAMLKVSYAEGKPDSIETWKAAAQAARERFGTAPNSRRVSDGDRAKFTSAPRGGGGGSEREGGGKTLKLSPEALAVAKRAAARMYSKVRDPKTGKPLSEQQMLQRWVNRVGPKVLEQQKGA